MSIYTKKVALALSAAIFLSPLTSFAQARNDGMLPEVLRPIQQQEVMDAINPEDFQDNLGNHIAEQDLQMRGNDIVSAGRVSGSTFVFGSGESAGTFRAGSIVSANINANNGRIVRAADPSASTDVVNLRTMQSAINAGRDNLGNHIATRVLVMDAKPIHMGEITGTDASGNLVMSSGVIIRQDRITGLASPASGGDAANKAYVDAVRTDVDLSTIVRTRGDQSVDGSKTFVRTIIANGGLNAGNSKVTNVADATSSLDAVNLKTLNQAIAGAGDDLGNHRATTTLNLSGNRIINLSSPATGSDAANKSYVDARVAQAASNYSAGSGIDISSSNVISADSTVIRTTGNQTMSGSKVFTSPISVVSSFNPNGSGPGQQRDGFYVADLGGGVGSTANPTYTLGMFAQTGASRSIGVSVDTGGYLHGFRSHVNPGTYTWTSKVKKADRLSYSRTINGVVFDGSRNITIPAGKDYSAGSGLNLSGTSFSVDGTVVRTSRVIGTGTGIDGGGNLSGNRTISLNSDWHRRWAGGNNVGLLGYNGFSRQNGQFYGGNTNPASSTRLNYDGNFYASRMWAMAYYYFSDRNLKDDIETIGQDQGMRTVMSLRPVSYRWKNGGDEALGVIAQEVQEVIPSAVIENEGGDLAVDYIQMIAPMIAAIQRLEERGARVEDLENRIEFLEAELAKHN